MVLYTNIVLDFIVLLSDMNKHCIRKFLLVRSYCTKPVKTLIPEKPFETKIDKSKLPDPPKLSQELVDHLERLSLVRFSNEDAVKHLEKAIRVCMFTCFETLWF